MGFDTDPLVDEDEMRIGFLFPGQGAQMVGMGKDIYSQFPVAKNIFDQADQILGYSLTHLCFEGPETELTRTLNAQPAIFVTSLAVLAILQEKVPDLTPSFTAGLSLGEFTALVGCKSISFEEGLRLVQRRAQAMEQCAEKNPGTMASILGMDEIVCEKIAAEAGCQVANLNAPDQIVISGMMDSVEKACVMAEAQGAKRVVRLKVGGAFHSRLMLQAKKDLEVALQKTSIKPPQGVFIPNALGKKVSDPEQIRSLLAEQLVSPVRWIQTMACAAQENIRLFLELGPGKVLKGLARKCGPNLTVESCLTVEEIQKTEQNLKLSKNPC